MKQYETISSLQNSLVKRVVTLGISSLERQSEKLAIVEGRNVITDLVRYKTPDMLFVTEKYLKEDIPSKQLYLVSLEVMKKISTVESPEGILALFPIQESELESLEFPCLILDGLQDPGNVGTLLRTASAFGVQNLAVIEPCCDLWHPKVMRSAKGAHYFFKNIVRTSWDRLLPYIQQQQVDLLAASLEGAPVHQLKVSDRWALALGSESQGLTIPHSASMLLFTIPMKAHIESLNVAQAGAIALYQFQSCIKSVETV